MNQQSTGHNRVLTKADPSSQSHTSSKIVQTSHEKLQADLKKYVDANKRLQDELVKVENTLQHDEDKWMADIDAVQRQKRRNFASMGKARIALSDFENSQEMGVWKQQQEHKKLQQECQNEIFKMEQEIQAHQQTINTLGHNWNGRLLSGYPQTLRGPGSGPTTANAVAARNGPTKVQQLKTARENLEKLRMRKKELEQQAAALGSH